jgi:hypothetical protein
MYVTYARLVWRGACVILNIMTFILNYTGNAEALKQSGIHLIVEKKMLHTVQKNI